MYPSRRRPLPPRDLRPRRQIPLPQRRRTKPTKAQHRIPPSTTNTPITTDPRRFLESGGAERSRDEYLGHHAKGDAEFLKSAHVQRLRQTARVEGVLAWIGTESEIHTSKDGKPLTLLSTETMILRQSGEAWRIVHIHWSSRPKN